MKRGRKKIKEMTESRSVVVNCGITKKGTEWRVGDWRVEREKVWRKEVFGNEKE